MNSKGRVRDVALPLFTITGLDEGGQSGPCLRAVRQASYAPAESEVHRIVDTGRMPMKSRCARPIIDLTWAELWMAIVFHGWSFPRGSAARRGALPGGTGLSAPLSER